MVIEITLKSGENVTWKKYDVDEGYDFTSLNEWIEDFTKNNESSF